MTERLVCGVGINDLSDFTERVIDGKRVVCPFYRKWHAMLNRCYSPKPVKKYERYANCLVVAEWLTFSNFKSWMEKQDWKGKELDKDIKLKGNRIYSPDACCFVTRRVNQFFSGCVRDGNLVYGCSYRKDRKKFQARCNNPITDKCEHLGMFSCEADAQIAWKKRKLEIFYMIFDGKDEEIKSRVEELLK